VNQNNEDVKLIQKKLQVFECIEFDSKNHTYKINGAASNLYSVTRLINSLKPKFDTDKWANIKAKKDNLTPEEIKFQWSEKALLSTTLGTHVHNVIESIYTNSSTLKLEKEKIVNLLGEANYNVFKSGLLKNLNSFKQLFTRTKNILIPIRNELVIGDLDVTRICGTLDFLGYNKEKQCLEIYDFKTNNNIAFQHTYKEKFFSRLEHLDTCEYNVYSLQMSLYRYILEKYTSLDIGNCYILCLNSPNKDYELIKTTYFKAEVENILKTKTLRQKNYVLSV